VNLNENLREMAELTHREQKGQIQEETAPYHNHSHPHNHNEEHIASYKLNKASLLLYETLSTLLHPIVAFDSVMYLTKSIYLETRDFIKYCFLMLFVYSSIAAICGVVVLKKRQLGLIQEE
jgi:hypothetical protein